MQTRVPFFCFSLTFFSHFCLLLTLRSIEQLEIAIRVDLRVDYFKTHDYHPDFFIILFLDKAPFLIF